MNKLKEADFPPLGALICLKPTAEPNCRFEGFDGRCHCEVPEQALSDSHPNLHICDRNSSSLLCVQLSGTLIYWEICSTTHGTKICEVISEEPSLCVLGLFMLRELDVIPETVYTYSVSTVVISIGNVYDEKFVTFVHTKQEPDTSSVSKE